MLSVNDLHKGILFEFEDEIYQVLEYQHIKLARGKATIKVKVRNLKTGASRELSFSSGNTVEEVGIVKKNFKFVYLDQRRHKVILAGLDSGKRVEVGQEVVGEKNLGYLREGELVQAISLEDSGEIINLEIPITVELKVTQTGPSEKGDSAGAVTKPATLETGLVIQVPMFIKNGDVIKVNTQRREYVERVERR